MHRAIDHVDNQWKVLLDEEFEKTYMQSLRQQLHEEKQQHKVIYPPSALWFNAFYKTRFADLRVVIIGQDPYHGPGQAHGLSFSVPDGVAPPPSLKNIFTELNRDLGISIPQSGNLEKWASGGVLLLNASLTVLAGQAGSHGNIGWQQFTAAVIDYINREKEHVAFLAWGKYAHKVCANVDKSKHLVFRTSHPSPLGAHHSGRDFCAFRGSGCFSAVNHWLEKQQLQPIDWSLCK